MRWHPRNIFLMHSGWEKVQKKPNLNLKFIDYTRLKYVLDSNVIQFSFYFGTS